MYRQFGHVSDALAKLKGERGEDSITTQGHLARYGSQVKGKYTNHTVKLNVLERVLRCGCFIASVLLILGLSGSMQLLAQNQNAGDIRGTVTDSTGAAITAADVTVTDTETGISKTFHTNSVGLYDAIALLPGPYSIRFSKAGFQTLVRNGITLVADDISVNAQLAVGTDVQKITVVSTDVATINTENAEQSTTISVEQLEELPNSGADWTNMTKLMPGAVGSGSGVNVNGTASYQSSFLIDGGNATNPASQNLNRSTPLDDIAQVQTISSNFSAQYGNGTSVFDVISKSGTNTFHGSLFEYNQNDFFNAWVPFSTSKPKERWNLFGGTVGGPIVRNRAFFYFSYQRTPTVSYSPFDLLVPTADARQGIFSDPAFSPIYDPTSSPDPSTRTQFPDNTIPSERISQISKNILTYIPLPNLPSNGLTSSYNYQSQVADPWTGNMYNGRIDYQITDANRFSGSFTFNPSSYTSGDPRCPAGCYTILDDQPGAQVTDVQSFGANLLNEARSSFVSYRDQATSASVGGDITNKLGFSNAPEDVFPGIGISGNSPNFSGIGPGTVNHEDEFSYMFSDALTWVKGKHILQFGGEYDRMIYNATAWNSASSGSFNFTDYSTAQVGANSAWSWGGNGLADFLLGDVDTWSLSIAPEVGEHARSGQMFAQDDYKLRKNLTINIGLRYAMLTGWSERHNNMANFNPNLMNPATNTLGAFSLAGVNGYPTALENTNYGGWQPRVGFAFSPFQTWSIRGGFGVFDEMWGQNNYGGGNNFGVFGSVIGNEPTVDHATPVFNWDTSGLPAPTYISASTFTPASLNGQWVTYQPLDTPISYVRQWSLALEHQISSDYSAHAAYVGNHGEHLPFTRDTNIVPYDELGSWKYTYPQFNVIYTNTHDGYSNYDSVQLTLNKKLTRNYAFDLIYNWSKTLDTGTASGWNWAAGIDGYQYGGPAQNYGPTGFDVPSMFKGDFILQLPVGKGQRFLNSNGVINEILGGWRASGFFDVQSGTPFTPQMSANSWEDGEEYGTWRPNRLGSGKLANPSLHEWFNTADFVQPTEYTFGNSGRGILFGPHYRNLDCSLGKSFSILERARLEVRADAFNALNHTDLGGPNSWVGSSGYGTISSAGSARTLQLGGRLTF